MAKSCGALATMTRPDALRARYDRGSDVLYLTICPDAPAISEEGDEPGLVWRYALGDGALVGVTVLDYEAYWSPRARELIESLVRRLHVPKRVAEEALEIAH
jgi:hypothetical protein